LNETQIHPLSDVQTKSIGSGTRIWQYSIVLSGAKIGSGCNVCAHVLIENDVTIGDNVTIKSGVQLWDGIRIGNNVFIGPNATFTNDAFPRSKQFPDRFLKTLISDDASIGANATILPGIKIGTGAMIGAGCVVTKDVPAYAIVIGNPGVIKGYTDKNSGHRADRSAEQSSASTRFPERDFAGCTLHTLPLIADLRGNLSVADYEAHIPFLPRRCFWVFDVPSRETRGEHAHKTLHQFLICLKGSINVVLDNATDRKEIVLNRPNIGIHIPPMVWGIQYKFSHDAVLLVFASEPYDANDYLRDYDEFLFYLKT